MWNLVYTYKSGQRQKQADARQWSESNNESSDSLELLIGCAQVPVRWSCDYIKFAEAISVSCGPYVVEILDIPYVCRCISNIMCCTENSTLEFINYLSVIFLDFQDM